MKIYALLGLLPLLAVTDAFRIVDGCVDVRQTLPCQNLPDGKFHVCNAIHLGYFAICQDEDILIKPCPRVEAANGEVHRLMFDPATQTCVEGTAADKGTTVTSELDLASPNEHAGPGEDEAGSGPEAEGADLLICRFLALKDASEIVSSYLLWERLARLCGRQE